MWNLLWGKREITRQLQANQGEEDEGEQGQDSEDEQGSQDRLRVISANIHSLRPRAEVIALNVAVCVFAYRTQDDHNTCVGTKKMVTMFAMMLFTTWLAAE